MHHHSILLIGSFLLSTVLHGQRVIPNGNGISGLMIRDMAVYDGKLVIAGQFVSFNGHPRPNIQGWDGAQHYDMPGAFESASWSVFALEPLGQDLIAAGQWGVVMRWNGAQWSMVGDSLPGRVTALTTYNGLLVASGNFPSPMQWDGSTWAAIGEAFNGNVHAVAVHDGELYAGGPFTANEQGTTAMANLARWNGNAWEQVHTGTNGTVNALLSTPSGLVVAGSFTADGSDGQQLPHWTVYDGNAFTTPTDDPGTVDTPLSGGGACLLPDGGYLVSGSVKTLLIMDEGTFAIPGFLARSAIAYNGQTFVGGRVGSQAGLRINGFGTLEEGSCLVPLDRNNVRAWIAPWASTFRHFYGGPGFEAPINGGVSSMYSAAPWITGTSDGVLHGFTPEYESDTSRAGPWATDMGDEHAQRYFQVWKLDRSTIQYHAEHWAAPNYVAPREIMTWPGNGDVSNGEPALLAPFADLDENGIYSPEAGEYPLIRGDQAVYHIQHSFQGGRPEPDMQVDLHVMQFVLDPIQDATLDNTVFTNYRWVNRSTRTYTDTRIGLFADFDLGCGIDDRIGCDSLRHVFYAYNGDEFDDACFGSPGYGSLVPAQGVVLLNEPLVSHRSYSIGSNPAPAFDLMHGTTFGQPFLEPGYPTHYQYPGGSWVDQSTETDRKSVGATGPFEFAPGDTLCLDLAYVFAQPTTASDPPPVDMLLGRVDQLRGWYADHAWVCSDAPDIATRVRGPEVGPIGLYPNPTDGRLTVAVDASNLQRTLEIRNATGHLVRSSILPRHAATLTLDLASLAPGVYTLHINGNHPLSGRFVRIDQ